MDFFRVRARHFFGFRHGPAGASLPSRLSEHQALLEPVAGASELDEPAMVHDAVLCGAVHYAKPEEGHAGQGPYVPAPALHNACGTHILGDKDSGSPEMKGDRYA